MMNCKYNSSSIDKFLNFKFCKCKVSVKIKTISYKSKIKVAGREPSSRAQKFKEQGFLVLEGFASGNVVAALRRRSDELLEEFDPKSFSIFSTTDKSKINQDFFIKSSSNICFFLEDKALDSEGNLIVEISKAVNKMGHAMHDIDPVFCAFSRSSQFCDLLMELGYEKPVPVQSMYIYKQPKIGGEVKQHQDSTYLYTEPPSCIGFWLALEDANIENGCLFVAPGSHCQPLAARLVYEGSKGLMEGEQMKLAKDKFVPIEVSSGTLVCIHGQLVHYSEENRSSKSRHAYTVHFIESKEGYNWASSNWLQRPKEIPFMPLYTKSIF